jgi:hypothetical protein
VRRDEVGMDGMEVGGKVKRRGRGTWIREKGVVLVW